MADLSFIKQESGTLDEALELAHLAVEKFYSNSSSTDGLKSLQSAQQTSLAARHAENTTLDLSSKSVPELIQYLTHRDDAMKQRAIGLVKSRAVEAKSSEDLRQKETYRELLTQPLNLTTLFNCAITRSSPQLQLDAIIVLTSVLNDSIKDRIRQIGALPTLATLFDASLPEQVLSRALFFTMELTTLEANAIALKQTKRIPQLAGLLDPKSNLPAQSISFLVGILRNLSIVPKNRDMISKAGVVSYLLQLVQTMWKVPMDKKTPISGKDAQLVQQILDLLSNLAQGSLMKTTSSPADLQILVSLLDGQKTIKKDWMVSNQRDQEFYIFNCIQGQALELLSHLSTFDDNKRSFGQLHLVQMLLVYFLPGEGLRINSDAMYFWLDLMNHLVHNEDNRVSFLKYKGLSLILTLISDPKSADYQQNRAMNHRAVDLVISSVSQGPQDDSSLRPVVQTLLTYCAKNTDDVNLLLKVMKVLSHLSSIESHRHSMSNVNGLLEFVTRTVLTHSVVNVIEDGCTILNNIGVSVIAFKKELNAQAAVLVPGLMAYVGNDRLQLQIGIVKLIAQVFADDPLGCRVVVSRGGTTVMTSLLSSSSAELLEQALAVLDNQLRHFAEIDQLRNQYMASGVLPLVVGLLSSGSEPVQVRACSLLQRVVDHRACKISLETIGLPAKLESLSIHPNIVKPKSMISSLVNMLKPKFTGSLANVKDAVHFAEENPELAADVLLAKLTKFQLIQLVKHALNQLPDMMPLINDTIQANIANPPIKKKRVSSVSEGSSSLSPMSERNVVSNETFLSQDPSVKSPSAASSSSSSSSTSSPPAPPSAGTKKSATMRVRKPLTRNISVLEELTTLSKGGSIRLKHVDAEKEKEKRTHLGWSILQ